MPKAKSRKRTVNLALQGGGAHGAYTWGVVDRLLDEESLTFEGITGTSAGALNAALIAHGWAQDGRAGAKAALADFWTDVAKLGAFSPYQRNLWDRWTGNWSLDQSPGFVAMDMLSRVVSPYQLNPFNLNPLRDLLLEKIDFDQLRQQTDFKLFMSATNVRTGKIKVFKREEVSVDVLMASACLPFMFQTVEIDGEAYWDGGYMGNPALYPLFYDCTTPDVLIVQINPLFRDEVPVTARGILNRVNEITFNATLMREMRAISFVTRLIEEGKLSEEEYTRVRVHMIVSDEELSHITSSSKLNVEHEFFQHLHDIGQDAATTWLSDDYPKVGKTSSIDLEDTFL